MAENLNKMTWKEIIEMYPDEWVELIEYEEDENGYLINGIVVCHSKNKKEFTKESLRIDEKFNYDKAAFRYTGEYAPLRTWEIEKQ